MNTAAVDFSVISLGTTAYSSNIRFTNFGTGLVSVSQLQVSGTNASDFAVYENGCGTTLAPTQYCDVYVQYTPSVAGAEIAYPSLVNNSACGNVVVALYGFGYSPTSSGIFVTPQAISFGVPGGYQTATASIQIGNPGGVPLTVQSATVTGPDATDFAAQAAACLPTENMYTIPLNFFSGTTGSEAATLTVVTSAGTVSVPLTGNASAPAPAIRYLNPVTIWSAQGVATAFDEIIYQIGTQALVYSVNTPAFTGLNASDFAAGSLSCDSTSFTCSLPIVFTSSTTGAETATLTLNTTSGTMTITVNGLGH